MTITSETRSVARRVTALYRRAGNAGQSRLGLALLVIAVCQLIVLMDTTIVTMSLPRIQSALGFSATGLLWVVNLYGLIFGGLLLLGGRAGDILGRRRVLIFGLVLFSAASLLGGVAQDKVSLLAARAAQGAGAALIAPAALALIVANFPEGPRRSRATSVYASVSALAGAVGLVVGGLLVTYASWRWTLLVNAPIGIVLALAAPLVLTEPARQSGRLDLPGAVTAAGGIAALVYGLSAAAPSGAFDVSHWASANVIAALAGAVVLLAAFVAIEARSSHPLLPLRILADRNRSAGYLSAAAVGVVIFAVLYFATLFFQEVWGYPALKSSLAYLPWIAAFGIDAAASTQLLPRIGSRPLMVAGSLFGAGGMYWLSRTGVNDTYLGHVLGAFIIAAFGLSLVSVPFVALALSRVRQADSGEASSVVNVAPLVGGSVGIAALGTVAWTTAAQQIHLTQAGGAAAAYRHALATGFDRAFLAAAGVALTILILAVALIRVRATGAAGQAPPAASPLAGQGQPQPEPNGAAPTTEVSPN
jgi:EmrB/QacA subfamily drug resistance transporter